MTKFVLFKFLYLTDFKIEKKENKIYLSMTKHQNIRTKTLKHPRNRLLIGVFISIRPSIRSKIANYVKYTSYLYIKCKVTELALFITPSY